MWVGRGGVDADVLSQAFDLFTALSGVCNGISKPGQCLPLTL